MKIAKTLMVTCLLASFSGLASASPVECSINVESILKMTSLSNETKLRALEKLEEKGFTVVEDDTDTEFKITLREGSSFRGGVIQPSIMDEIFGGCQSYTAYQEVILTNNVEKERVVIDGRIASQNKIEEAVKGQNYRVPLVCMNAAVPSIDRAFNNSALGAINKLKKCSNY